MATAKPGCLSSSPTERCGKLALLALASLMMGAALVLGASVIDGPLHDRHFIVAGPWLIGLCGFGMIVYGIAAMATGAVDVRRYAGALLRRGKDS